MRRLIFIPIALLAVACANKEPVQTDELTYVDEPAKTSYWFAEEPEAKPELTYDIEKVGIAPKSQINILTEKVVNELVLQNDSLRSDQPLLVTTPVRLDNFNQTDALGLQLQQGFVAAFHGHEFNLVDLNVAKALRATEQGEFILSRDWKLLPSDLPVSHVVVSTMDTTPMGLALNTRIVNVSNNRVVSAVQTFVNMSSLPGYLKPSNKVISDGGLLYRNEQAGLGNVAVLGDKQ
ncbi:FlgO family outer membrane protein [Shewanella sp. TC10]|uniref:FlgO family outer membrane protein n=1 Tax=Shewanella sp. TC10 TaxID=1419739 RepID=UPI00129E9CBF|nr:FlgO family outer membrane protein [Shewanella sp. TC10]